MTTPASKPSVRVMSATPGVVSTPALRTVAPAATAPRANTHSIQGPDSRVSRPITMRGGRSSSRVRFETSDLPMIAIVFSSSGYSPATARMPSVPNSLFLVLSDIKPELLIIVGELDAATEFPLSDAHLLGFDRAKRD